MPRSPSKSANRPDLTMPQAPSAAPGQEYGAAAASLASQSAVPMAGGAQPPAGQDMMAALQAHTAANPAGARGAIDRPTERPNEPVTHGLPVGPGGGPEVLSGIGALANSGAAEQGTLQNLLSSM